MGLFQRKLGSVFRKLGYKGALNWMDDELYLCLKTWSLTGEFPDLDNPRTFNEKLQWLKLHDRNPFYTKLVDKYAVKEWVADRIGPQYVTQTYARWDRAEDIDVSGLPERFVLKTNHDCGGIAICRDRDSFDLDAAKKKLAKHLKRNYFWGGREWPYKNVRPCVFAEEYIEPDDSGDLADYKLFRFSNGRIVTLLITDRFTEAGLTETFFDEEWRPLELTESSHPIKADAPVPSHFGEMKALADRFAGEFPFVCVDFYESAGRLLFGEMALYPNSGFESFEPADWDVEFGSWIDLGSGGWLLVSAEYLLWVHEGNAIVQPKANLTDYKFMCFGGEVRCVFTCTGRADGDLRVDFFDTEWNHLPFTRHYRNADSMPQRPHCLSEMVGIAENLSAGIPFVRVDFYEQGDRILFGEMTFYPGSGFEEFEPESWDEELGSWIELSSRDSVKEL